MILYSHIIEDVQPHGGVTEWLKVTVLKTVVAQATAGSNPVPSAKITKIIKFQLSRFKTLPFPISFIK